MSLPLLRWYGSQMLDEVGVHMGLDPAYQSNIDLTFRDAEGSWWRPQRDGSWVGWTASGWRRATRPNELEGVASLPIALATEMAAIADREAVESPSDSSAPSGLARCVARTCASYRSGLMVSMMAELILSDWKLLTADGRLWTIGARSRVWYAYGDDGWEVMAARPEGPFVSGDKARTIFEDPDSPARAWALQGPRLPERLTAEWMAPNPPEGFVPATADRVAPPPPPLDEQAPPRG